MVPTQKALGVTWVLDPTERVLVSPEELLLDIQGLVAGRMAEKVFMGGITS